jgi:putative ATP-dependent endonuclease of the OLD family
MPWIVLNDPDGTRLMRQPHAKGAVSTGDGRQREKVGGILESFQETQAMSGRTGIAHGNMRLEQFSVENFRSIRKAERLPLGEFTVLLGPNNEGKSNILQAMVIGMQELSAPRTGLQRRTVSGTYVPARARRDRAAGGYDWDRDFPRTLQEAEPDGKTTMRFDFQLTEDEVAEFYDEVGSRLNVALPITLVFGRSGAPVFRVRKRRHAEALSKKRVEIARFVATRVQVEYIQAIRTGTSVQRLVTTMVGRELAAAAEQDPAYADALAKLRDVQRPVLEAVSASITEKMRDLCRTSKA